MAAAVENPHGRHRLVLAGGLLAAAFLATRLALLWRFPWFVDETTFATFARDVHGNLAYLFVAESDKKGLLPSWLGAALISAGIDPVTAMRLLAGAGAALAAACGGLVVRRLYGIREGIITAALVGLGPYFLVTASIGIYDAMVTGLVAAAVLVSIRLAQRPRPYTALLLGAVLGAGGLTKPTASVAVVVLPFTLLLFDWSSPRVRARALEWAGLALFALVLGYGLTSIARLSPYYGQPIGTQNQRQLSQIFEHVWPVIRANGPGLWSGLHGYFTIPGVVLAVVGAVASWRRDRAGAAILAVWTLSVLASALLLALWAYPRYFAAAIVPLSAFAAVGAVTVWDSVVAAPWSRRAWRTGVACALAAVAVVPAARFDASVLADPVQARYPGTDGPGYVTATSAQTPLERIARTIEDRGGPYPVHVDVGLGYPWGLDIRLNGAAIDNARRYDVFSFGTPTQLAAARYVITDGETGDAPPRPGFRLIRRAARPDGGAVMRLFERVR
ncbi:MAG: Dolichyl-phosphate-mannose-protein mannosyltransferase [Gaiellales bacterium]|jgi:4-amino-4-deoxy-L-arabinose transferase-like glycosyltransferase|nr:Dolichyl-phosphate-mannose-protein mannosyltransferase [Gaiellales bacterium]